MLKSKKVKLIWYFTIALSLMAFIPCFMNSVFGLMSFLGFTVSTWKPYYVLRVSLYTIIIGSILLTLIIILVSKKPFHKVLSITLLIDAIAVILYSYLLPRFPEHQQIFTFTIMENGSDYLMDGWYVFAGVLLFLCSKIAKYGLNLQDEVDDIV